MSNQESTIKWYYKNGPWIEVPEKDNITIEEEYKDYIDGCKTSQRVYHCFGDRPTCVNFDKMITECSSMRCFTQHHKNRLSGTHVTFGLKRDETSQ